MINSSVSLASGFSYGVPYDFDFRDFYDIISVDELSDKKVVVGHCPIEFSNGVDYWDVSDLMEMELGDIRDFIDFYVKLGNARFVKLWEFMITPLCEGSKEKVVEESLWASMLIKWELSIVYSYYRLLVGVGKRGGKRGDWK